MCREVTADNFDTMFPDDDKISAIKKDLRTFLTGCSKQTQMFFQQTLFLTNPNIKDDVSPLLMRRWGEKAIQGVWDELSSKRKKKIDGKDWNAGWMGSVWKDMTLNGVQTRICYYSRKMNPEFFKKIGNPNTNYVIMLDPHNIDKFQ